MSITTLPEALDRAAQTPQGYVFATNGVERRRSYAEIRQAARRIAGALCEAGLGRGDVVALVLSDAEAFLTAFFAVSIAGMIPASMAPPPVTARIARYFELTARILRAARARAIVASDEFVADLSAIRTLCPDLRFVYSHSELDSTPLEVENTLSPDDVAFIQFTSGSTSSPRGVAVSHRNLSANIDAINGPAGLGVTADDSAVSWLPLHHDMGLVGMALGPLYASRPGVLLPPHAFIKRPVEWLKAISRHRATVSFAPDFGYEQVVRRVKDRDLEGLDLSCWRVAGCGAEPIHASTLAAFAQRLAPFGFPATSFLPCYGLAEHVLAGTFASRGRAVRVERSASGLLVSCGRPLPGHQLRIVTEEGRGAAEREIGEITLAGPSVMLGYYGDDAATARTIRDGWLYSGDLGYVSDGELFVCGRSKDIIIANGVKYHPQDLERALDDVEGVRHGRVVAFGAAGHGRGDRVVIVVENSDANVEREVAAAVRRRISDTFGLYVDEVVLAPAGTIGRTTSGKVQRAATKAWYTDRQVSRLPEP
jgi:fatty-acyl-CoA synthase